MSRDDLESEGLLVLVRCCKQFPKGEERFARYFKRALYNHLKKMIRFRNQDMRKGMEVGLDMVKELSAKSEPETGSRLLSQAEILRPHISPIAYEFLRVTADPGKEVAEVAWQDFCRRNKLKSLGLYSQGWKRFRIKARHVRKVLALTPKDVRRIVQELRMAHLKLIRRKHVNGQEISQSK